MKLIFSLLLGAGLALSSLSAQAADTYSRAYFVATQGVSNSFSFSAQKTHIILVGRGAELNGLFQAAAATRATRLHALYPNNRILMITALEGDYKTNRARLEGWGFKIQRYVDAILTPEYVEGELQSVRSVASVDIFAHTSAVYGMQMGGGDNRISAAQQHLQFLRGRFVDGAYAVLHGCNSGYHMAPMYAKMWGIPVAGSFAATEFEKLHSDNQFYLYDENFKPAGPWASMNSISFPTPIACDSGACMRMRPDNWPYEGIWGDYKEGGLGIFKFFCPATSQNNCEMTMAEALVSNLLVKKIGLKSSEADLVDAAHEFLCPSGRKTKEGTVDCVDRIQKSYASGDTGYTPFKGHSIQCDFKGCTWEWKCKPIPNSSELSCDIINTSRPNTDTFMKEYAAYRRGLKLFTAHGPRL
jgi:hypothetical protein